MCFEGKKIDFISTPYEKLNSDNSHTETLGGLVKFDSATEQHTHQLTEDEYKRQSPLIEYSWTFFDPDRSMLTDEEAGRSSTINKLIHSSKDVDGTDSMLIKRYSTLAYGSIPGSLITRPGDAEKADAPVDDAQHGRYDYETTLRSAGELNLNSLDATARPDWLKRLSAADGTGDRDKKKKVNQGIGTPGKPGHEPDKFGLRRRLAPRLPFLTPDGWVSLGPISYCRYAVDDRGLLRGT